MPDPKRITIHKLDNGGIVWEDENGNQLPPNWDTLKQWAGEGIGNMIDRVNNAIVPDAPEPPADVTGGQLGSPQAQNAVVQQYDPSILNNLAARKKLLAEAAKE